MQAHGLNWNSLVFAELLLAHFFSGGYIPFAQEKWHDSTAAEDKKESDEKMRSQIIDLTGEAEAEVAGRSLLIAIASRVTCKCL